MKTVNFDEPVIFEKVEYKTVKLIKPTILSYKNAKKALKDQGLSIEEDGDLFLLELAKQGVCSETGGALPEGFLENVPLDEFGEKVLPFFMQVAKKFASFLN